MPRMMPDEFFAASASGGALFLATIDGPPYGSSVSNNMFNSAGNQLDDNNQPCLVFILGDVRSADDLRTTRNIRIIVAKKTGAVRITKAVEVPEDIQLTVTELSATRVKGSFNGKMYHVDPTPDGAKKSIIVDAKFDLPIVP